MCPFELVATATDSPRYSPGGSLRKFGTEVKGISGTFWALAFCCASAGPTHSIKATAQTDATQRVMRTSREPLVKTCLIEGVRRPNLRQEACRLNLFMGVECSPDGAKRNPGRRFSDRELSLIFRVSLLGCTPVAIGEGGPA